VLSAKEELLVQTIRSLPERTTEQMLEWASRLAELAAGKPVEWSDSWTDEDIQDASRASLRRLEGSGPEAR